MRFFVPEEYYCRPINIIPRPYYGAPSASFSSWEAYPTFSTDTGWRDVCDFLHFKKLLFSSFMITISDNKSTVFKFTSLWVWTKCYFNLPKSNSPC